uniref:Very-long-chain (3R)-3-hydroxyacyl-CoA dehydratase n=1 Tax=Globodera rostochiensis TaxID=31243 RepID=A0A914I6Z9_GLORO
MIDKFDDRGAATAAASMNHHQETNPGNMHDDQNISGVLGLISAMLDLRRWMSLAIAFYFCSMNVIVVPVACLCTLGLFLLPLKLISMSLFNRLEHELCRLVNDAWMSAGKYCGLNIVEYGDDITRIANKRALCIVNHLGLLDHFCLMTSFHDKGSLAGKYMWVIFNIWQWNPVGAMWTAHGNFFVYGTGVGDAKRAEILKVFKRHLQKNYWKYNYGWVVMYPEGSRLFLIKKSEQRFCAKEGLVPFKHCTHPRVGAAHAVLQICGPKTEQEEDKSPPVEYIVDVTLGYHRGVVPQFARSLLGIWPFDESGNIAVYYRIHHVKKEWCEDADLFREWLYEQYRKKDQLLAHFYKTGKFLSNADDSNSAHLRGRTVDVSDLRCLLVQIVWLALFYFHFNMWIRPMQKKGPPVHWMQMLFITGHVLDTLSIVCSKCFQLAHWMDCLDKQQTLRPFVYWAQDSGHIYLKVDVKGGKDVDVLVLDGGRSVQFSSFGLPSNSQKECKYAFRLPLYDAVQESPEVTRVDALRVEFRLSKAAPAFWGNGILSRDAQKQAHHWLKFDFEKWTDDPDDQSAGEEANNGDKSAELKKNQYMERLMRELDLEQDKLVLSEQEIMQRVNMLFSSYLFLYNIGMFIFTFYILCSILANYVSTPRAEFLLGFWSANFRSLLIVTVLQSLDALHAFTRLTSAGYKASLIQVSGRLAMLMIINGCPPCWQWSPVFTLILAYLISEQFRYPYYALKTLGISLHVVTWLRYNMWLLLYPLGFFLEGLIMLGSVPFYYESGVYSLRLPNAFNFSYNFGLLLAFFTFTFFPFIGFTLIKHMLKQRKSKMEEMRREEAVKRSREKKKRH